MNIPFNIPYYTGNEISNIEEAIKRNSINGDGYYTELVSKFIQEKFNAGRVLMTTSATHALELSALMLGLEPGDEVIMPSFTYPSTANAVMLRGAVPIFAEIQRDTLNLNPREIEDKITNKTRALLPVHYAGVSCEMDEILSIAKKHNLQVIEDAAHAFGSKYKNEYVGKLGHAACFSFHGSKNYCCGEGGALVINSDYNELIEKAETIRQKGTNRKAFLKGEIENYTWTAVGSSYSPSDILMAFLYPQLMEFKKIILMRKKIWEFYRLSLEKHINRGLVEIQSIPPQCESNYHLFYILLPNKNSRDNVMKKLNNTGISAVSHFRPLHSSPMGLRMGYRIEDLPLTQGLSQRLLRLPLYNGMSVKEMEYVSKNLNKILCEV